MNVEDLQAICYELEDVTADIKWGHDLCFSVKNKIFLVTNPDVLPVPASFKTDEESFNKLIEKEGFKPAPYLARYKWVQVDDINRVTKKEWQHHIHRSYEMINAKIPKKKKNKNGKNATIGDQSINTGVETRKGSI